MAKLGFLVVGLAFVTALASAQGMGQISGGPLTDFKAPVGGSALTCSSPTPEKVFVPVATVERARVKARLVTLLRLSLFDDAKGIVNIEREKEIRKLANKLKKPD